MTDYEKIDAIAEDCLKLNNLIEEHGTDMMRAVMRVLLFEVAQQIAHKQAEAESSSATE
ncbi:hypothetical protein [Methylobacterium sp. J-092]|uniref:hypothetical protein n=1 Tax=Methylobacterium sp. J-092 TaxID=2836667 RepID=UPI001FB97E06|nr:hypothetical protein [Methylobacterium sp. J-092]MCJ2009199.1 hypothetical protein [Methylobacterium sp. J-092]